MEHFDGVPKEGNLKLIEEELPPIKNGEFLAEAVYIGVEPGVRALSVNFKVGDTFLGSQVAKIIDSKNPRYPVGQYVVANFGWRTHTISDGIDLFFQKPVILSNFGDLPLSLALGALGIIGLTAYFGFLEICTPRAGETVVVTSAAGAVGNHVGQIAKIKGCKVVGVAGSDEKVKWLVEELGFDKAINYKTADLDKALTEAAPEGVDCYFDNVGGEMSSTVLRHMNNSGRISVCGAMTGYNEKGPLKVSAVQPFMVGLELKMEGFIASRWTNRSSEAFQQNLKWIKEGKLKYRETVTEGFENIYKTFIDVFKGGSIGKSVVKV